MISYLIKFDEADGFGGTEWLLWIDHQVQQGLDPVELIVAYCANGLLTHSTLIGVPRRLIVMRIGNETRADTMYVCVSW